MPTYSIIIPVFNRPDEVNELLGSLAIQTRKDFEVKIIEDGSSISCKAVVDKYLSILEIEYFNKENTGQGFSRNFGAKKSSGFWLIFFDSDCIIPPNYIENLHVLLESDSLVSAITGPDAAPKDFSYLQRAISYSMTALLTTGGIRGNKIQVDREVHLRSYNLVMKKEVFDKLGGFAKTNMGEDMEISHRFHKAGYKAKSAASLKVFHKRRNTLKSFFWQVFSFGRTRVQLKKKYGIPIKLPHLFPFAFVIGFVFSCISLLLGIEMGSWLLKVFAGYFLLIFVHSSVMERNIGVGFLSVISSFLQHTGYGLGFLWEVIISRNK